MFTMKFSISLTYVFFTFWNIVLLPNLHITIIFEKRISPVQRLCYYPSSSFNWNTFPNPFITLFFHFDLKGVLSINVQCIHLIPALNALAARAHYTTVRPIAAGFSIHGCIYDPTTERSFDSQVTWVIDVLCLFLICCPWLFIQPSTGRRPVIWCRD